MKTINNYVNTNITFTQEEINDLLKKVDWDKKGMNSMIPVITQDIDTKEVLMQAYVNKESFENTLKTGNATYWSRSRNELWEKGLTSGATQKIYSIKIDCDRDSIIYEVKQLGDVGACHIDGQNSCFETDIIKIRENTKIQIGDILNKLTQTLEKRKTDYENGIIDEKSYTMKLFNKGLDAILKKISEETVEVILGAKNNDKENIIYEIGDLMYFINVLMVYTGISFDEIALTLYKRFGVSGITEKENRNK